MTDTLLDARQVIAYLHRSNLTLSGLHSWLAGREIEDLTKGKERANPGADPNLVIGHSHVDVNPVPIHQREKGESLNRGPALSPQEGQGKDQDEE